MGSLSRAAWIALYLVLAVSPLIVAVSISAPPGNGFGWDFAIDRIR